jgi:hypothetical protein
MPVRGLLHSELILPVIVGIVYPHVDVGLVILP